MPKRSNTFQRVVAIVNSHMAGDATVEESAMVTPLTGGEAREVDALIVDTIAGHEVRVAVEASKTKRAAGVEWVERMLGKHDDLPTDRLILYSGSGFTKGARTKAEKYNVIVVEAQETTNDADISEQVLGGLKTIWSKFIDVIPRSAKVHVRRPDNSVVWFHAREDLRLYLEDQAQLEPNLQEAAKSGIRGEMEQLAEEVGVGSIVAPTEREATLRFPLQCASADGAQHPLFVEFTEGGVNELHRVELVELKALIVIDVERVDLRHIRLGDVHVAYGELESERNAGIVVISAGGGEAPRLTTRLEDGRQGTGELLLEWIPPEPHESDDI